MTRKISVYILLILISLLLTLGACIQRAEDTNAKAKDGFIDLSEWNFAQQGPAVLDGEWKFNDGNFNVPSLWKGEKRQGIPVQSQGRATYRLKVKLKPDSIAYSLYISGVLSVCDVQVNGKMVGSTGIVGSDQKSEHPEKHFISPGFSTVNGIADINIEVSNYHNSEGGINSSILIGSHDQIQDLINFRQISGAIIGGALLIMAIFHLIVFSMRKSNRENLYFGLFCSAWCIATIFSPPSAFLVTKFISIDWGWYIKISLLSTGMAVPLLLLFYNSLFPHKYGKEVCLLYAAIGGLYAFYTIISPPGAYSTASLLYFIASRTAYFYLFAAFLSDLRSKRKGAIYLAPGYVALFLGEFDEILFDLNVFDAASFAPFGTFIFILSYSLLMSARFAETLSSYEKVSGELQTSKSKEHNHKMVHLRLSKMLDSVDEAILAVNRDHVIDFCNYGFEKISGYKCSDIQGATLGDLFESDAEPNALSALLENQTTNHTTHGKLSLPIKGGDVVNVAVALRSVDVDDEPIWIMNIRKVETKLNKRELAVAVMNTSLECWEESTGHSKADLASESTIWNIYIEKDGYARTQTLDRYLNTDTLPERPRWKNIYATAEFVINNCPNETEKQTKLKQQLSQLKKMS